MNSITVTYSKNGIKQTTEKKYELEGYHRFQDYGQGWSTEKKFYLDDDVEIRLDGKKSTVKQAFQSLGGYLL